jgi:hypothetical protein
MDAGDVGYVDGAGGLYACFGCGIFYQCHEEFRAFLNHDTM